MPFCIPKIIKQLSNFQITVYMVLSQKKFAPLRSKGKPFFSQSAYYGFTLSCKNSTLFFLLKQQRTLTRTWWYDLAEQFFSHQGLSTFYFQAMGGAKKNTRSYLTLTSPSQNICLFAVIDVYSVLEFPICEKKVFKCTFDISNLNVSQHVKEESNKLSLYLLSKSEHNSRVFLQHHICILNYYIKSQ